MNIPINQVTAFCTVARTGSFAQAALQLHLSQPALSIAIRNLEQSLGGKLLDRTTRNVALTPEGKAFFPVAKRLLADWEQSLTDVKNHFLLARGKLEIAAMPTYATNLLPRILSNFHFQYPHINVTVHDVIAESVVELVRESRSELGITFLPADAPDLVFTPLYNDIFIAILPKNHELLKYQTITWKQLLKFPQVSLQKPAGTRALIDQALQKKSLELMPVFESHQLVSIGKMVSQGLGLSVVPSTSEAQMLEMNLAVRAIKEPEITHQVGLIEKRHQSVSAASQAIKELIVKSHKLV